jgi:RsiW-degrading membrane proteinase PrsW (M82 family)
MRLILKIFLLSFILMLRLLSRVFVALALLAALAGALTSIAVIFFPLDDSFETVTSMQRSGDFVLIGENISARPDTSPLLVNYTIFTPDLGKFDQVRLQIYSEGRYTGYIDCLEDYEHLTDYENLNEFNCTGVIPYIYADSQDYVIFATLNRDRQELASGPLTVKADWGVYEDFFWDVALVLILLIGAAYTLVLFPITLTIAYIASSMKHHDNEYTIFSLLNPFANKKTLLAKFNSFLVSPYFWILEILGILIVLAYMLLSAQVWKSAAALFAFLLSGLLAFMVPFLWCAAWWYADFREREPLRLIITFFLWGMLAALMAIGINTLAGLAFELFGLGFLGAFLITPLIEEFYKGSGIALFGEHREFNSIEDGLVYGFVIGMGFSFIEDWTYLLSSPMGSDIFTWLIVFFLRSLLFSANHGVYTAIVGGTIGLLIERGFKAPALGLIPGVLIAALFHAVHNSGETLGFLFGAGGLLAYCCFLLPLFDYGGLIIVIGLFIWALFRRR